MQIQQIFRRNNSEIQEINENIVINTDHSILRNRDLPNQHPISAIEGLQDELNSKAGISDIPTELSQLNDDSTHRLVSDTEKQEWNDKAERSDIPTNVSELNNDSNYQTNTEVANAINTHNQDSTAHQFIQGKVTGIESKIPNQASSENQLADKNFVNSSISTATATFKGTWESIEDFPTTGIDENDYVFYRHTDNEGNTVFDRYKYTGNQWIYEYTLNNSSFTSAQWTAINSQITSALVEQIGTNQSNISTIMEDYIKSTDYASNSKAGVIKTHSIYGIEIRGFSTYLGTLIAQTKTYEQYSSLGNDLFVGKGTLENALVGKGLVRATTISSSSTDDNVVTPKAVYDFVNSLDSSEVAY